MSEHYSPTHATKRRTKAIPPEKVDVTIIGAGLGGLQAGAELAQKGVKVAVFDHHYVAGGCCTQFSRGSGENQYNFDIGLHYIGDCEPGGHIPRILEGVGVNIDYVPMDQDGFDTLVFPDFEFKTPKGHDAYQARLMKMFPKEKSGIKRYVRFLKEIDALQNRMNVNQGKMSWGVAFTALTQGRLASKYTNATIGDFVDTCTDDPRLKAVMLGQNGDYGVPPKRASAALHAGLTNHYFKGAYYTKGGGQVIADGLADRIEELGGTVHLRRGIEKVLIENGQAVGVRTEAYKGEQFDVRADIVISNADLAMTLDKLVGDEHLPEDWKMKREKFEMAAGIFMTCAGVEGDLADFGMRSANYWVFDGYDMDDYYDAGQQEMQTRGCYITSATMKDPGSPHHAPAGISTVEIMTILSGKPEQWDALAEQAWNWDYKRTGNYNEIKQRIENECIARLDKQFPGTADKIVFKESATPMSHMRFTRATDGTGYGLAATPEQFMAGRPGYRGPVPGLFLAGANTRAGHGVLGSLMSGQRCAARVHQSLPSA